MKTDHQSVLHPRSRFLRNLAVAAWLGLATLAMPLASGAGTAYSVAIDTGLLAGTNGLLAFDFIGGDGAIANNTVSISGLSTDGLLGSLAPFSLTDTSFFNEELRTITFGSFARFNVALTENVTAPGVDQFSFFLLDPVSLLPLVSTSDGLGTDALFAIDITGVPGGDRSVFDPLAGGASWRVAGAPDGGSTAGLLALGCFGLLGLAARGRRLRRG